MQHARLAIPGRMQHSCLLMWSLPTRDYFCSLGFSTRDHRAVACCQLNQVSVMLHSAYSFKCALRCSSFLRFSFLICHVSHLAVLQLAPFNTLHHFTLHDSHCTRYEGLDGAEFGRPSVLSSWTMSRNVTVSLTPFCAAACPK